MNPPIQYNMGQLFPESFAPRSSGVEIFKNNPQHLSNTFNVKLKRLCQGIYTLNSFERSV